MKMNDVELGEAPSHPVQHRHIVDERVLACLVESQRLFAGRLEQRRGLRIAARKKSDLVTEPEQFLGQIMDDAFGAAVEPRGQLS